MWTQKNFNWTNFATTYLRNCTVLLSWDSFTSLQLPLPVINGQGFFLLLLVFIFCDSSFFCWNRLLISKVILHSQVKERDSQSASSSLGWWPSTSPIYSTILQLPTNWELEEWEGRPGEKRRTSCHIPLQTQVDQYFPNNKMKEWPWIC